MDPLLPELADRKVLRAIDSTLDDTVPADRPITLRDLLTLRLGIGAVMAPPAGTRSRRRWKRRDSPWPGLANPCARRVDGAPRRPAPDPPSG